MGSDNEALTYTYSLPEGQSSLAFGSGGLNRRTASRLSFNAYPV